MDEEMVQAIKDRKLVPHKYISVAKMLELNGMSEYESICCKRILELYAGDRHIIFDIFSYDVLLDHIGFMACYDILQGYILSENLSDYKTYIKAVNGAICGKNKQIKAMRDCPTKSIKEVMKNPAPYFDIDAELSKKFVDMIRLELKARKPINRLRVAIKRIFYSIATYAMNYFTISFVNMCFCKMPQE